MERLFALAKPGNGSEPAGWVGQITSDSFMKREFGVPLIERFLVGRDLRLVADTSGAYIPGHGTPTLILIGRNQPRVSATVRAVLGVRGEPGRPPDPAQGHVWRSITEHVDEPGWEDRWVSVADLDRTLLDKHPWSLSGGGALDVRRLIEAAAGRLERRVSEIGFGAVTREDSAYMLGGGALRRAGVDARHQRPLVEGDVTRDWLITEPTMSLWPYEPTTLAAGVDFPAERLLWPHRAILTGRVAYGQTQLQRGLLWFEYSMFFHKRYARCRLRLQKWRPTTTSFWTGAEKYSTEPRRSSSCQRGRRKTNTWRCSAC